MNKKLIVIALVSSLISGVALATEVRDWHDLKAVHEKVKESIHDLERAASANHYDMGGHAKRAEELLRQAEHELHEAVESARDAR